MNIRTITTVGGGAVGGFFGRNFGAWEVSNLFPNFHETHGYNNEVAGTLFGAVIGAITVNISIEIIGAIAKQRKDHQSNINQG